MADSKEALEFEANLDFVSLRTHYDEELLLRFYNGLMKTNFPIGDELEAVENWIERLNPAQRHKIHPKDFVLDVILAMITKTEPEKNPASFGSSTKSEDYAAEKNHPGSVGHEEKKTDERTISGGIVFEYYKESSCALVTYFVVDTRYRKQGVVKTLLKRTLKQLTETAKAHGKDGCSVTFAETNATGIEDGVMPSTVRHKIMQRLGMGHVGCEYIQPPLDEGKEECYDLILLAYLESPAIKKDGQKYTVPAEPVKVFLQEFARGCYGFDIDPKEYVDLPYMKQLFKQFEGVSTLTVNPDLPWPGPAKRPEGHEGKDEKKELKHLIIAGPPAGGKGTQCEFLKSKYDLVHLSTGDLLREEVKKETELGKQAKVFMDKGELVPNHLLIGVVQQRLKTIEDSGKGWLLDGFPRTEDQSVALTERGVRVNGFILLDVPDEVVVDRMEGRRWDPVANQSYHLKYLPPPPEVVNRLITRSDDNVEKFKVRLGEYHKNLNAVKGFFKNVLHAINGNQSPAQVSASIVSALESHH